MSKPKEFVDWEHVEDESDTWDSPPDDPGPPLGSNVPLDIAWEPDGADFTEEGEVFGPPAPCPVVHHVTVLSKGEAWGVLAIHSCPHVDHPHVCARHDSRQGPHHQARFLYPAHDRAVRDYRANVAKSLERGWVIVWQGSRPVCG